MSLRYLLRITHFRLLVARLSRQVGIHRALITVSNGDKSPKLQRLTIELRKS